MVRQFDFEKIPVVEIVNEIMVDAAKRGASDIHFDPLSENMKIRIRVDGLLSDYAEVPNNIKKNLITRIKIISGMNITESRLPQDGAIKAKINNVNLDLRVSCLPTSNGEKIVIRILDYTMSLAGIESLGFSEENYKKVLKMIAVPNGIILVTGATGSGKSTTVYSILQRLNTEESNVITVEDPVEMNIEGINQIQTNSEIGLTFSSVLRSILRQDPNIIMIGEIRDTETAKIAVRASITGHLVLSTIHTNNSLNTIERLLDMDVERYLLASALEGIISQVLARKLCPHCRTLRKTNDYEKEIFKKVLNKDVDEIYTTEGCEECGNGYSGRIAIHEVLLFNQDIRDAISAGMRKEELRKLVFESGVNTMLQDGLEKVLDGLTTFEEVIKLIELGEDEKIGAEGLKNALDDVELNHEINKNKETIKIDNTFLDNNIKKIEEEIKKIENDENIDLDIEDDKLDIADFIVNEDNLNQNIEETKKNETSNKKTVQTVTPEIEVSNNSSTNSSEINTEFVDNNPGEETPSEENYFDLEVQNDLQLSDDIPYIEDYENIDYTEK